VVFVTGHFTVEADFVKIESLPVDPAFEFSNDDVDFPGCCDFDAGCQTLEHFVRFVVWAISVLSWFLDRNGEFVVVLANTAPPVVVHEFHLPMRIVVDFLNSERLTELIDNWILDLARHFVSPCEWVCPGILVTIVRLPLTYTSYHR